MSKFAAAITMPVCRWYYCHIRFFAALDPNATATRIKSRKVWRRIGHDRRTDDRQTHPVLNEQVCGSDHDASDERKRAGKQHEVDNKSRHLYAPRFDLMRLRTSP